MILPSTFRAATSPVPWSWTETILSRDDELLNATAHRCVLPLSRSSFTALGRHARAGLAQVSERAPARFV